MDKRPLKVFLCHAHADRDPVRGLYGRLTQDGVDAWLDKAKLLPGQDWELEIRKAVREADVVVVCLSKQFNQAGFRQKEVRLALDTAMEKPEGEIFIIPARLEECDNLESLRKWHWVDLFEEDGYEMLMRALRVRANKIGATLQVKKSWLPKITSPNMTFEKTVEKKKSVVSTPEESESKTSKVEQKVVEDKEKRELAEKVEEEKKQRELKRALKKTDQEYKRQILKKEWQHKWVSFVGEIRYRLNLLFVYRTPILILLVASGFVVPLLLLLSNLVSKMISEFDNTPTVAIGLSFTPQQNLTSTDVFVPAETFAPTLDPLSTTFVTFTLGFTPTPEPSVMPTKVITSTPQLFNPNPNSLDYIDKYTIPMRLVSSGKFVLGNSASETARECSSLDYYAVSCSDTWYEDEQPPRQVYLDAYYIDKFEVTNDFYRVCVDSGVCSPPLNKALYDDLQFKDHPVAFVNWNMAKTYCTWRGARLPTEAEWEKAARGPDGRFYPWGGGIDCEHANYSGCSRDESYEVGYFENGISPYGVYEMAGNVEEWVADWYSAKSYFWITDNVKNPQGVQAGEYRVVRGGSFRTAITAVFSTNRDYLLPSSAKNTLGFRCARDGNP